MKRLFRMEVYWAIAAAMAAGASYWLRVDYLPSVFLVIVGFLLTGVFAELEDEMYKKIGDIGVESHDWHLYVLRLTRTIVLLIVGVLIFAALIL